MTDPHKRWKDTNGDNTLALNWDLTPDSHVWEIGGFEGRWAAQIAEKFDPYITIFEPTQWGYGKCSALFFDNPKVNVKPYGLWVMDAQLELYNPGNDGASLYDPHTKAEKCQFKDAYTELGVQQIDLCLMNVEGAEFALLPYMIGNDMLLAFRQFWCQFHLHVEDSLSRITPIFWHLNRTHEMKWNYFPTAVAWERRA